MLGKLFAIGTWVKVGTPPERPVSPNMKQRNGTRHSR